MRKQPNISFNIQKTKTWKRYLSKDNKTLISIYKKRNIKTSWKTVNNDKCLKIHNVESIDIWFNNDNTIQIIVV